MDGTPDRPPEGSRGSGQPKGMIALWLQELDRWTKRRDREMGGPVQESGRRSGEVAGKGE